MNVKGKKIYVGLSGGVDSAVTAALLQDEGADIRGVFIKGWYPPQLSCTWATDRRDAMRVASRLRIPFITLDASAEYKKSVIDYLLSEYRAGRTPNPDIMCNREVKFGAFYDYARARGADYIATGHYARAHKGTLMRGVDPEKDQSYFLWAVPKEAIAHALFPLGETHKSEVRKLARKLNVPVAQKRDSQGICFLGSISVDEFLRSEFGVHGGKAVDEQGTEIGTHDGVLLHTLGERVALSNAAPGPWYAIKKDIEHNVLTVSRARDTLVSPSSIALSQTNWFSEPASDREYEAQYRYHGPRITGRLTRENDSNAEFLPSHGLHETIAAGQSLVIYDQDTVVGGGIIA